MKVEIVKEVVLHLTAQEFCELNNTLIEVCKWDINEGHRETIKKYLDGWADHEAI